MFTVPSERPVVIDGGLATQLEAAGNDLSADLWSARLLIDAPDQIVRAHEKYFLAGAEVAITASYQASFAGFARHGIDRDDTVRLLHRSVALAQQARDRVSSDARLRWVAASIGPYGASLADGSEYRGRYGLTRAQLWDFHRPRLEALADAGPDLLAIETIPDLQEAAVIAAAIEGIGVPAWLSYTVADGLTRAGQPLAEAFAVAENCNDIIAVGANCSAPGDVAAALGVARRLTTKAVVGYPNSGETWDALNRRWDGIPGLNPELGQQWSGTGFVGGCCRTGPADIARLAQQLRG